jgi:hypothetical protein
MRECAYAHAFQSSQERAAALGRVAGLVEIG